MTTPATAQDLSAALISALESNTVSPLPAQTDVTFDILLAEDNLVNQKLAVKILEKYGHAVEIAENGSLAVDSFKLRVGQGRSFDIVLVSFAVLLYNVWHGLTGGRVRRWMCRCRSWVVWRRRSSSVHLKSLKA